MNDDVDVTPGPNPDIETRLRHALAQRAGSEPARAADWGDLAGRLASSTRRRQRVLAGAAGLALLVGAAGGYLGEAAATTAPVSARAPRSGSAAVGSPSAGAQGSLAPSPGGGPSVAAVCPGVSGGSSDLATATRLFIRHTADGVTIRVYQDAQAAPFTCIGSNTSTGGSTGSTTTNPATSSSPPASGSASSTTSSGPAIMPVAPTTPEVTVELSDADAVGQGAISTPLCVASPEQGTAAPGATGGSGTGRSGTGVPVPGGPNEPVVTPATTSPTTPASTSTTTTAPSPPSETRQLETGTFGVIEGDPVWWVAVEVASDVTSVQMTFPDGSTDQMAPVGGVAVLAHRVSTAVAGAGSGPYVVRGTLQLVRSGGVISTVTLPETPSPGPIPGPLDPGTPPAGPGVIVTCPPLANGAPSAQSSATTEKR